MKVAVWGIVALIAFILIVATFGHILLLAACVGGGFLLGRGYEKGKLALSRSKAHGTLGQ